MPSDLSPQYLSIRAELEEVRLATHESIAEAYEKAHAALLSVLEELPEETWSKVTHYPSQYRTVAQIAHRPTEHFAEHAAQLRRALGMKQENI